MSCLVLDLCLTAGKDFTFSVLMESVEDIDTPEEVRTPIDLTGSQILMKIRKVGAASNDLEIDSDAPADSTINIPLPLTGVSDYLVSGLDTVSLALGGYCHEISRVIGTADELVFKGKLVIEKGL